MGTLQTSFVLGNSFSEAVIGHLLSQPALDLSHMILVLTEPHIITYFQIPYS